MFVFITVKVITPHKEKDLREEKYLCPKCNELEMTFYQTLHTVVTAYGTYGGNVEMIK